MTNSEMMIALLRTLKVEMNGAVVGAMESRGLHYPLNYGVSLPTIKAIASDYAPNHSLAELLYQQQVRELRLAAMYIAQPEMVIADTSDFWADGVCTGEIAEVLAMKLLSQSQDAEKIVRLWLECHLDSTDGSELLRYAALMTAARAAKNNWDIEWLKSQIQLNADSESPLIRRATELLADRIANYD